MMKTVRFYSSVDSPDGFVGARIFESRVDFYFPLGMGFDIGEADECREKAHRVLEVITAATASRRQLKYSQDNRGELKNPFNSFVWILKDYYKNGLYSLKRKQLVEGYNGKINWKRTFDKVPLVKDGNLNFLYPVAEKNSSTDSIVTVIHKYCLTQSVKNIGWLFSIEEDGLPFRVYEISEVEKNYFRQVLLRELRHTFEDRRKLLLSHLLRVIENAIGQRRMPDRMELGTYEFHQVWEEMIQKVYGNLPVERFFPSAMWCLEGRGEFKSSNLRPDTVLKYDNKLYILDAKYYKFGVLADRLAVNLPNSDSIQKQITYGDHAELKMRKSFRDGIRNAFIVPFCAKDGEFIEYAGYATASWQENNHGHRRVHLLLMDMEYLMRKYWGMKGNIETIWDLVQRIP